MAEVRMTMEEYLQLLNGLSGSMDMPSDAPAEMPKKKRSNAYQKRYKANFRKIAPKFKLKSGKWKKNGFRAAVRMAHKMSKK